MKKIATSLLILLAIPVFGYLYLMYFYEADPLTQKYIDEKDPVVKLQLLERIMDRGEDEKWSWSDNAAEIAFKTGDYDKAEKYALTSLVVVNKIWSQVKRQVYILPQLQQVLTHH